MATRAALTRRCRKAEGAKVGLDSIVYRRTPMPIPSTDSHGLLPAGIHDCTLEEVGVAFGQFRASNRRLRLFKGLQEYVGLLSTAGIGKFLYIDGSFVTVEASPNDVDILLVLRDEIDLGRQVPPFEYNVRSGKYLKRRFDMDFFVGYEGDSSSQRILSLFRRVKGSPGLEKGILRLPL